MPEHSRWVAKNELMDMKLVFTEHLKILERWFSEGDKGKIPNMRPPWERKGWWQEAVEWIESKIADLGYFQRGSVVQFKSAWSNSAILRVYTNQGWLYFKSVDSKPPSEVDIILELAKICPQNTPSIVAFDRRRRWMLMHDFTKMHLKSFSVKALSEGQRRFAELQIKCSQSIDKWNALGCPDHRLETLEILFGNMLKDSEVLTRIPNGLNPEEYNQLLSCRTPIKTLMAKLSEYHIPSSLHRQDHRIGNLAITNQGYIFFDWGDTVISIPSSASIKPYFHGSRKIDNYRKREYRRLVLSQSTIYSCCS